MLVRFVLLVASAVLVSAQESECYGGGSIAGAVIGSFVAALVLVAIVLLLRRLYWNSQKGHHLVLVTDPENVKDEFAFDNAGFKSGERGVTVENGRSKTHQGLDSATWLPGDGVPASGIARSRLITQDDTAVEHPNPTSHLVSLWSRDFTGLGLTVTGGSKEGIYVANVLRSGPAAASGLINTGDRINSVRISFRNMVLEDATTILSYASPYEIQIEVVPSKYSTGPRTPSTAEVVHPVLGIGGAMRRRNSLGDFDTLEKASKHRHFTSNAATPNSNDSTLEKSNNSKSGGGGGGGIKKIITEKIITTTLEKTKPVKEKKSESWIVERENEKNISKAVIAKKLDVVLSKPDRSKREDQTDLSPQIEKAEVQTKGMRFGVRVLPQSLNEELNKTTTSEVLSIDEVDKYPVEEAPVVAKRREKPAAPTPNTRTITSKTNETETKSSSMTEVTFERDAINSSVKRDENGIPQEIPKHMLDAALVARNSRKIDVSDADKTPKKYKGKAPSPPIREKHHKDLDFSDNFTSLDSDSLSKFLDTEKMHSSLLLLNTSTPKVEKVIQFTNEDIEDIVRPFGREAREMRRENDSLNNYYEDSKSNVSYVSSNVDTAEEDAENERKATSLGDLSKLASRITNVRNVTLERAQSLDISADADEDIEKAATPKKRKATEVTTEHTHAEHSKEPRLSLNVGTMEMGSSFQTSRLKKASEFGNLEDAIINDTDFVPVDAIDTKIDIADDDISDEFKASRHTLVSSLERPKSEMMKKLLAQNPVLFEDTTRTEVFDTTKVTDDTPIFKFITNTSQQPPDIIKTVPKISDYISSINIEQHDASLDLVTTSSQGTNIVTISSQPSSLVTTVEKTVTVNVTESTPTITTRNSEEYLRRIESDHPGFKFIQTDIPATITDIPATIITGEIKRVPDRIEMTQTTYKINAEPPKAVDSSSYITEIQVVTPGTERSTKTEHLERSNKSDNLSGRITKSYELHGTKDDPTIEERTTNTDHFSERSLKTDRFQEFSVKTGDLPERITKIEHFGDRSEHFPERIAKTVVKTEHIPEHILKSYHFQESNPKTDHLQEQSSKVEEHNESRIITEHRPERVTKTEYFEERNVKTDQLPERSAKIKTGFFQERSAKDHLLDRSAIIEDQPERITKTEYLTERSAKTEHYPERITKSEYFQERSAKDHHSKTEHFEERSGKFDQLPVRSAKIKTDFFQERSAKDYLPERSAIIEHQPERITKVGYFEDRSAKTEHHPERITKSEYFQERSAKGHHSKTEYFEESSSKVDQLLERSANTKNEYFQERSAKDYLPERSTKTEYFEERSVPESSDNTKIEYFQERSAKDYLPERSAKTEIHPERITKTEYFEERSVPERGANTKIEYFQERSAKDHFSERSAKTEHHPERITKTEYFEERSVPERSANTKIEYFQDRSAKDHFPERITKTEYFRESLSPLSSMSLTYDLNRSYLEDFLYNERLHSAREKLSPVKSNGSVTARKSSDDDLPRNSHIKFRTATYETRRESPEKTRSQIEILRSNFERGESPSPTGSLKPAIAARPSSIPIKLPDKSREGNRSSSNSPSKIPVLYGQRALSQENLSEKSLSIASTSPTSKISTSTGNISVTSIKSSSRNPSGK